MVTDEGYVSSGKNDLKSECLFLLATPLFDNSLEGPRNNANWVRTLHRVPIPSSFAILAKALKTLVYPLRSSGGSLWDGDMRKSISNIHLCSSHYIIQSHVWIPADNCIKIAQIQRKIDLGVHNNGSQLFIKVCTVTVL